MKELKTFKMLTMALACLYASTAPALSSTQPLPNLPGTPALQPSPTKDFTFFVCGDNRPASADLPVTGPAQQIIAAAAHVRPQFIIWLGDTIYGKNPNSEKTISQEYTDFLNVAAQAHVPIFNAPGNHEMDDQNDVPNATMQSWYEQLMAPRTGSFVYGNACFIALDTEEIAPPGVTLSPGLPIGGDKNIGAGYVSAAQLSWLNTTLQQNRDKTHIFIFMHHSVYAKEPKAGLDQASANAIKQIIANYPNVAYLLSAHEHLYYCPNAPSNVTTPLFI